MSDKPIYEVRPEDSPAGENNTADAPLNRPHPLQHSDKADTGCMILLFFCFVGVFFVPAFFFLGGAVFIVPLLCLFLIAILTPFINPFERRSGPVKWYGRVGVFLFLIGLAVAGWLWFRYSGNAMPLPEE